MSGRVVAVAQPKLLVLALVKSDAGYWLQFGQAGRVTMYRTIVTIARSRGTPASGPGAPTMPYRRSSVEIASTRCSWRSGPPEDEIVTRSLGLMRPESARRCSLPPSPGASWSDPAAKVTVIWLAALSILSSVGASASVYSAAPGRHAASASIAGMARKQSGLFILRL